MKKKPAKKTKRKTVRKATRKKGVVRRRPSTKARSKASLKKRVSRKPKKLEEVGTITHYFPKVKAGVMKVTKGALSLGDEIHIKGHTTDFKQKVTSIQLDRVPLEKAVKGQEIGIAVKSRVRQKDIVYRA